MIKDIVIILLSIYVVVSLIYYININRDIGYLKYNAVYSKCAKFTKEDFSEIKWNHE